MTDTAMAPRKSEGDDRARPALIDFSQLRTEQRICTLQPTGQTRLSPAPSRRYSRFAVRRRRAARDAVSSWAAFPPRLARSAALVTVLRVHGYAFSSQQGV